MLQNHFGTLNSLAQENSKREVQGIVIDQLRQNPIGSRQVSFHRDTVVDRELRYCPVALPLAFQNKKIMPHSIWG